MGRHPLTIVGDRINTSNAAAGKAVRDRDAAAVAELVRRQIAAGAGALDLNAWSRSGEADAMAWLVGVVRPLTDLPLWIDTTDPAAAEAGLTAATAGGGRAVLNSVSLEPARFEPFIAIARRFGVPVVAQCLSVEGPPYGSEERVRRARMLTDHLLDEGFICRDIVVDLCLTNHKAEPEAPEHLMRAILRLRMSHPEVRFTAGIRNFGYGLPQAERMRREAKAAADLVGVGLDSPLADPARFPKSR